MFKRIAHGLKRNSSWMKADPSSLSASKPYTVQNFVAGEWKEGINTEDIIDPMNGEIFIKAPLTDTVGELNEFRDSLMSCPKYGLHNPLYNVHRYQEYGDVIFRAAKAMDEKLVEDYFTELIQRVAPKSDAQARGEVVITKKFLMNFAQDGPRTSLRGFIQSGDHDGQQSQGYRWPFGACMHIGPFNFPLEIPVLHVLGGLISGNKLISKTDSRVSIVMEQFLRLLLDCGLPPSDLDMLHSSGEACERLVLDMPELRLIQFVGSNKIANRLSQITNGKVRLEDAGFDWKILGPDVKEQEYVAYQMDQDAYAFGGQKCSATSIVFAHENWMEVGIIEQMKQRTLQRNIEDLSICPILSWNNDMIQAHVDAVLKIPGSKLLFGGKALTGTQIPKKYGSYEPTAIYVPIDEISRKENWGVVTKELFGPFQIITSYDDSQFDLMIKMIENFENHLTAGIVSNDPEFVQRVLGRTCNGVTYSGIRARTTGAPQNHWFGPCGDPRAAGIGTIEAIQTTWTGHREIVHDIGLIKSEWTPEPPH